MRLIQLSDHPGQLLQGARAHREVPRVRRRWWFDSWGNKVEQGRITDATGRSPSVQLNEPADELPRFLHSRRQPVSITRVVLLNHARSKVGRYQHLTVHLATSSDYIIDLVNASAVQFQDWRITQLEHLIEKDHRFHNGRS